MTLRQLLTGVPLTGGSPDLDMEISSISYDTRTIEPGALFAALSGDKTDGHLYIQTALDKGAAAVLCEKAPEGPGPWLVTEDSRCALALASANWFGRPGDRMTLVAVTGTNGKTTTTSLLKELLERVGGAKVGLVGTNRNMIGDQELPAHRTTPESYELQSLLRQMADEGCTHVVMEASSHALVQRRTAGLTFAAAVFTNLTQDHLDYHRTMEAYREAKGLLFRQCRRAVLNLDDRAGRWYRERVDCPVFTYSENNTGADLSAKNIRLFPGHVEFEALILGDLAHIHLPIPGGFSIYNALAALSAGLCLGLGLEEMAAVMPNLHGVKGRVEVVPVPRAYTVLIDYAHNGESFRALLRTLRPHCAGRILLLFGAGGDRPKIRRTDMGRAASQGAEFAVLTTDNPRSECAEDICGDIADAFDAGFPYEIILDRREAIFHILDLARSGDIVALLGKGHEEYIEENGARRFFSEWAVLDEYFSRH